MAKTTLGALLERVVLAGVAITTRALSEARPGLDLTVPQWRVIVVLGEERDGATVSEVADRIGVTLPATSRQLRRLVGRGLVTLARDERDRRAARARLTTEGNATRRAVLDYRHRWIAAATSQLGASPSTLAELARAVEALERSE